MLDQYTYEFDNSCSGRILKFPTFYVPTTGWDVCDVGASFSTGPVYWAAFFSFDTSNLPAHCEVTSVKFRVFRDTDPIGDPADYEIRFSIGQIIGGSLDGNAAEWNGGTEVLTLNEKPENKTTIDFASAACALVDKTGDTDVKILDHSTQGVDLIWSTNFNKSTTERCKLYVYFTVPSATLTASSALSCAATVTHAAAATVTGVGDLDARAGLLLSSASATMTGRGTADCAATVTHDAAATLLGVGTASISAAVTHPAAATLTGFGDLDARAGVIRAGAATLTGIGDLSCAAKIDIWFPALAIDEDTISVVAVDSASLSVGSADTATIAVAPDDELTVGRRRN